MIDTADRAHTLDSVLASAVERYVACTPESRAHYEAAQRSLAGGNTRSVLFYAPYPLTIQRGRDSTLWDADGHEYLDFLGEYTAGLYGHSHPVIRAAIDRALVRRDQPVRPQPARRAPGRPRA